MKEYNFLAFDIGATSGRAVLGTLKDAKFEMKEIHRFPNPMVELHGRFYWDTCSDSNLTVNQEKKAFLWHRAISTIAVRIHSTMSKPVGKFLDKNSSLYFI